MLRLSVEIQLHEMNGDQGVVTIPDTVSDRVETHCCGVFGLGFRLRDWECKIDEQWIAATGSDICEQPERDGHLINGLLAIGPADASRLRKNRPCLCPRRSVPYFAGVG